MTAQNHSLHMYGGETVTASLGFLSREINIPHKNRHVIVYPLTFEMYCIKQVPKAVKVVYSVSECKMTNCAYLTQDLVCRFPD